MRLCFKIVLQYGPRYEWSSSQQSYLLGSYFWGYLITSLPGGPIAEWIGGRTVVGVTMGLSGLLTALIPLCASISFWALFGVRMLIGILAVSASDVRQFYFVFQLNSLIFSFHVTNREYCILHCIISFRNGHRQSNAANLFQVYSVVRLAP